MVFDFEGLAQNQGDQIGRIFAYWAIVYLGQIFESYISSPNYRATFFNVFSFMY
jgi:hypothetical protein